MAKKVTIEIPDEVKRTEPTEWYVLCPYCDYKSACSKKMIFNCPECGWPCFCLPCGIEATITDSDE